jgi:hypothetical protein
MKKKATILICICSALCITTLVFVMTSRIYSAASEADEHMGSNDKGRNERSTPRSFILPATPAVALGQEKKQLLRKNQRQIQYCMLKLYDFGYETMNFEDIFDIHIYIALMDYQMLHGLPKTGELNKETVQKLGCNE